jgi:hypothetical protein
MMSEKQRDAEERRRLGKELDNLEEQMKAAEGYRLRLKIRALSNSYYVFEANYRNLTVALDRVGPCTKNGIKRLLLVQTAILNHKSDTTADCWR